MTDDQLLAESRRLQVAALDAAIRESELLREKWRAYSRDQNQRRELARLNNEVMRLREELSETREAAQTMVRIAEPKYEHEFKPYWRAWHVLERLGLL